MKFGFVNGGDDTEPKAQCVECGLMLSNEALKPSKRKENGLQIQKRDYKYRIGLSFLWPHNLTVHGKLATG